MEINFHDFYFPFFAMTFSQNVYIFFIIRSIEKKMNVYVMYLKSSVYKDDLDNFSL